MLQNKVPLIAALQKYVDDGALAFHTPGHKQGKGVDSIIRKMIMPLGLKMDVSLMEELDDLFAPASCIKEAQQLAADLYGADESLFMINGTTGAIEIMLLAALKPGDKVIVPRNAHKSVLGAIVLCGANPIFVQPMLNEELGIAMAVSVSAMKQVIQDNTDAKAIVLVYPTYYGVASDVEKITSLAHAKNMLVLVDEAHGPHLKFAKRLPIQALDADADMAAQSTHKILSSFTQTSILHLRYGRIDKDRVHMANSLLQSTSPNYLLMASLDAARRQMGVHGKELINKAVDLAMQLRRNVNEIKGLYCFGEELVESEECFALDYTKVTVTVRQLGISGYQAEYILRHKYKIQCELADMYNVLFIVSLADSGREIATLTAALKRLAAEYNDNGEIFTSFQQILPLPAMKLIPRRAIFAQAESILLEDCENRLCAETVTFYPPGIPIIYPGEVISHEFIEYVKQGQRAGAKIVGPADISMRTIKVIK